MAKSNRWKNSATRQQSETEWLGNRFQYRLNAVFGTYFVLFGLNFVKITKNSEKTHFV